jgi:CO dehydrogenase/acetyl-CoA synthase delta subunit
VGEGVPEEWGDLEKRGIAWEILTATTLLHAGADILSLRHPESVKQVRAAIDKLIAD